MPITRATVIRAQPLGSAQDAERWLGRLRRDPAALDGEVGVATRQLNRLMRAHRAAANDPMAPDVDPSRALTLRIGHASGQQAADGRFDAVVEPPRETKRRTRAERLSPQERLAEIVGAHVEELAADELVLRARGDVDAGRPREAALQARVALECVLEELDAARVGPPLRGELERDREPVSAAAGAALAGEVPPASRKHVEDAVERMEHALRRHRAG